LQTINSWAVLVADLLILIALARQRLMSAQVRLSTGFSIIWQSPLGPLRADIAQALLKADFDKTEIFRFGASTNF